MSSVYDNFVGIRDLEVDGSTLVVDETNDRIGIGLSSPKTKLTVEGAVTLKEQAAADTDTAAYGQLWVKTATPNELYYTTDAGDDIQITSGTGIAGSGGGDITGVTAGNGLSGGGSSGGVSLALDLNELSAAAVNVANDSIVIVDADDSNASKKESIADLATAMAGTGLSASSGQLTVDTITSVGTIGTGTWQGTAIAQAYIANDAINGDKIADDAINSEHYTDGSIDTAHIADDQVTLAKMAGLARGALIVGDSSGNPSTLTVGSDNHVLTVDSNGDIGWEAASGGSVDLNGLSAAAVNVANDSIGIIDADDSNASKKESIADFISAVAGTGLSASSGQLTVSSANTASAMVTGGNLTAVDAAQQIIAAQVFS